MRMLNKLAAIVALAAFPLLSGCGFTPLYATAEPGAKAGLAGVHFEGVNASEKTAPVLARAFTRRAAPPGADGVRYDLFVDVREAAQALAVQIDSSVTRYNYNLTGNYRLTRRADGKVITGSATSVASFNVVNSQYSTLFAEEAAREKAARALVDAIERDYLLKLAALRDGESQPTGRDETTPVEEEPSPLQQRTEIP